MAAWVLIARCLIARIAGMRMFATSVGMALPCVPIFPAIQAPEHQIFRHRMRADPEPQMEQNGQHGHGSDESRHETLKNL
jgi:hypothetical protein